MSLKKSVKKVKEKDLQKSILDYLRLKGYIAFKFPSVGIFNRKTNMYIPMPSRGISDIIACSKEGKFLAIEVKVGYNKPSDEQLFFIKSIEKNNGIAFVATSLDEVMKRLNGNN